MTHSGFRASISCPKFSFNLITEVFRNKARYTVGRSRDALGLTNYRVLPALLGSGRAESYFAAAVLRRLAWRGDRVVAVALALRFTLLLVAASSFFALRPTLDAPTVSPSSGLATDPSTAASFFFFLLSVAFFGCLNAFFGLAVMAVIVTCPLVAFESSAGSKSLEHALGTAYVLKISSSVSRHFLASKIMLLPSPSKKCKNPSSMASTYMGNARRKQTDHTASQLEGTPDLDVTR